VTGPYHVGMTLAERRDPAKLGGPTDLHMTWRILAGGSSTCAQVLLDIAENGRVEASRVAAAKTVLEMAGFKSPDTVQILPPEFDGAVAAAGVGESPAARIRSRMAALAMAAPDDPDTVDAEIVVLSEPDVVEAEVVD
jgi:hypothetical protein